MKGTKGPDGTAGGAVLFFSVAPSASAAYYLQLFHGSVAALTTLDVTNELVIPSARTLKNLRIYCEASVTKDVAFTVFKNGASTGITCTITNGNATASDLSNTLAVAQGDKVALQALHTAGAPGGTFFYATLEAT